MAAMHEMADPEPIPEMILQDEEHSLRFRQQLLILFEEKQFSDVVLKSGDHKEFPCHRLVLAAASSYFKAMFNSGMVESSSPTVVLEKMDSDILSSLIRYMYSGSLKINTENVQRLVESTKPLNFIEVIKGCEDFMLQQMCPINCIGFKRFAELYELERLKEAAQSTMLKEFSQVVRSVEFGELSLQEIMEYISDSELKVKTEDPIFEAVCLWVRVDPPNRETHFPQIAAKIRFPYCSKNYLSCVVVPSPYMSNPQCAAYLQEACTYHMLPEQRMSISSPRLERREDFQNYSTVVIFGGIDKQGSRCEDNKYACPKTGAFKLITKFTKEDLRNYAVVAFQSGIFVTGGEEHEWLKKDCFWYDFKLHEWRDMPPMMEERSCHGSVAHAGNVYVLGGNLSSGVGNSVEVYNMVPGHWTSMGAMPKALTKPLTVSYSQYIFVTSGKGEDAESVSTMVYDTVWDRWENREDMPKPVINGSITAFKDKIYVVGGDLPSCLSYDMAEDAWTVLMPPNKGHACAPAFAYKGMIRIYGGKDATNKCTGAIEDYDVRTDTWFVHDNGVARAGHHVLSIDNIL